jgi:hypothetical protein
MENQNRNTEQGEASAAAAKAKQQGTQPPRHDIKEQRGGPQDNKLTGETTRGAQNNEDRNRNP